MNKPQYLNHSFSIRWVPAAPGTCSQIKDTAEVCGIFDLLLSGFWNKPSS